jgi:sulfur transfer complex TusBCD TusB component (DsrH family)
LEKALEKFSLIATLILIVSLIALVAPLALVSAHDVLDVDVETCEALDFTSPLKYSYVLGEPVYARGKTQNFSTTLDIYLVEDIDVVNGQVIPERVPGP